MVRVHHPYAKSVSLMNLWDPDHQRLGKKLLRCKVIGNNTEVADLAAKERTGLKDCEVPPASFC